MKLFIKLLLLILICPVSLWGQLATMDQIPTVRQAKTINSGHIVSLVSLTLNNVLVTTYTETATIALPTIADSCGSTWTLQASHGTGTASTWIWTAPSACNGSDTITVTAVSATSEKINGIEIAHCTCTVETTGSANTPASGNNITFPNVTTTHYNDFLLEILAGNSLGNTGADNNSAFTTNAVNNNETLGGFNTIYIQSRLSGNPGTITGSVVRTNAGGSTNSEFVIAFRSASSIIVTTPAIPDAVVGQVYSFQLNAVDGVGTNVWTVTSGILPCGLSLSSSGVINGTPTCANGNTIRFTITDSGTNTNFADLTIKVSTTINTPVRIQGAVSNAGVTLTSVAVGHAILFGFVNSTNFGASLFDTPIVSDGCGTTYARLPGPAISMTGQAFYSQFYIGFGTTGGTCVIATGLAVAEVFASEWSNLQPIFDTNVAANLNSTGGGATITSGSLTVPTANEMLYSLGVIGTGAGSISINSPYTTDASFSSAGQTFASGYQTGTASGAQTSSFAVSGNTSNIWGITLFGLRPTTTGTPVVTARRKSQEY